MEQVQKGREDGRTSDMFMHTDIMEGPKEGGPGAHLQLGKPLTIRWVGGGEEEYEDLDEVLARYAEPFVANIKQVLRHRWAPASPSSQNHNVSAILGPQYSPCLNAPRCVCKGHLRRT
jgi:hypothetical protein